jgi:hypothetical protein
MNDLPPVLRVQQLSHRFAGARDAAGQTPWAVHEASLDLHLARCWPSSVSRVPASPRC